jgi:hypothetical protein
LALIVLLYYHKISKIKLLSIAVSGAKLIQRANCVFYWLSYYKIDDISVIIPLQEELKFDPIDIDDKTKRIIKDIDSNVCILPYDEKTVNINLLKKNIKVYASLNDFFKAIAISLLMEDVFAPTSLQTNDDSAPTGQLSGATPSVSSNIFDDLELDENQRLDLFDKAQKALVNLAGGLVESQGTYSPEELKEQMPSIMKKWVEENKIEADEQQIEEMANKVYNQFDKRTIQMKGLNVSNINWQMIESADPIEFTLRYVGKDTTLESLKELRRLISAGESERIRGS